ncbi:hypothetical protein BDF21DRAFT_419087 [Thamnidium elegans]|uniref:Uncharacterized protein n=1 Tax=Thamnidium elegans TaxID=101142 RepID=A0A8H7SY05_9FUNG|nr:hypothetical protein INT48_003284 [Thamnidium elegans]KAI8080471.1 hypothetical protein BDF21DRAFT_419087 [Thamnidium elegans]
MKNYLFLIALICFLLPILSVTAAEEANAEVDNDNGRGGRGGGRGGRGGCGGGRRYGDRWNWGCNVCWCDRRGTHCTRHRCHYVDEEPSSSSDSVPTPNPT